MIVLHWLVGFAVTALAFGLIWVLAEALMALVNTVGAAPVVTGVVLLVLSPIFVSFGRDIIG